MGEALNRISRDEPAVLEEIRDYRDIISFRNILVHGYDAIDDHIVWDTIQADLENLIADARCPAEVEGAGSSLPRSSHTQIPWCGPYR